MPESVLIRRASLRDGSTADIRLAGRKISEIARDLPGREEREIDARGGLLLPGLHDHHVHIAATAAAMASVRCGPPQIHTEAALAAVLAQPGETWLRGIGYHESVTSGRVIDRAWLDRIAPHRPVRVQHRTGRLWIFNSAGIESLLAAAAPPPGLDLPSGHLFDSDSWLREALGGQMPALQAIGEKLAAYGVTGITDMTPANDAAIAAHFAAEHIAGALPQNILLAGRPDLTVPGNLTLGPLKIHLHEARLPDYAEMLAAIRAAHESGRTVAVHCVTETELVFTLAALREAGASPGDRIEHASVTPDPLLEEIAALGLIVCVQPNFAAERGDAYLAEIPAADWPSLYRLRAFQTAGVTMLGGTDTPYGAADPWAAMQAAVNRRTAHGRLIGEIEALSPEAALDLFLADPQNPTQPREIAPGAPADLCLLGKPWAEARKDLSAGLVRASFICGRLVYDRVDQPPFQRLGGVDALAG